jgi:hypothetical protein
MGDLKDIVYRAVVVVYNYNAEMATKIIMNLNKIIIGILDYLESDRRP